MTECSDYVLSIPSLVKDSEGRSPYWICCYSNAEGRRLKKSTKQKERSKAWEFCLSIERAEKFAKAGTLSEQAARKILGEIVERTTGETLHHFTVEDWFESWVSGKEQTNAPATAERYKQVRRDFLESLGGRQKLSLAHITPKDILQYRTAELAAGKSPKTANTSVKIVSTAFNAAFRQSYIPGNPCKALENLPEETAERDIFTPEQVTSLIEAAVGDWRGATMFGYYTGARLSDVANMQWNAIDLQARTITFLAGKTKKKKKKTVVPLHPVLERELLKSPGIGKAFIFPSLAGKPTGGKSGLSGQFNAIMEKAGIAGEITRHTPGGRANSSLSFHSFRHTFTSALANAGVSQEIRQKLTGHASAEMNKIYTHHEIEPLRAAIATLPSI